MKAEMDKAIWIAQIQNSTKAKTVPDKTVHLESMDNYPQLLNGWLVQIRAISMISLRELPYDRDIMYGKVMSRGKLIFWVSSP